MTSLFDLNGREHVVFASSGCGVPTNRSSLQHQAAQDRKKRRPIVCKKPPGGGDGDPVIRSGTDHLPEVQIVRLFADNTLGMAAFAFAQAIQHLCP